jgi:hypothetical protein
MRPLSAALTGALGLTQIERFAPGFRDLILARPVQTARDIAAFASWHEHHAIARKAAMYVC